MVIYGTKFQHKEIHQATWLSPDRKTHNHIDHVVIEDVCPFRDAKLTLTRLTIL